MISTKSFTVLAVFAGVLTSSSEETIQVSSPSIGYVHRPENDNDIKSSITGDNLVNGHFFSNVVSGVRSYLEEKGYSFNRVSKTSDGSVVLENISDEEYSVEIYPSGELIVIARNGDKEIVHEVGMEKLSSIPQIIDNGLIAG